MPEPVALNSQHLTQKGLVEFEKYKGCFSTLLTRSKFVNLYTLSQCTHVYGVVKSNPLLLYDIEGLTYHS